MNFKVSRAHKDFWFDDNRWVISYGGAGSGKSLNWSEDPYKDND